MNKKFKHAVLTILLVCPLFVTAGQYQNVCQNSHCECQPCKCDPCRCHDKSKDTNCQNQNCRCKPCQCQPCQCGKYKRR